MVCLVGGPHYRANYYAAFVIGPDGHIIEVVCYEPEAYPIVQADAASQRGSRVRSRLNSRGA
jgi:hypothetical protein